MSAKASLAEQRAEIGGVLGIRRNVYPKWVAGGRLSQALADRQIDCMDAAYETLKWLEANMDWIKVEAKRRMEAELSVAAALLELWQKDRQSEAEQEQKMEPFAARAAGELMEAEARQ